MAHLLSKRVTAPQRDDFCVINLDNAPEGFKMHPDPVWFASGMPNAASFPIESISVNVVDRPFQKTCLIDNNVEVASKSQANSLEHVVISRETVNPTLTDLATGLQYSETEGLPQLVKFTENLVKKAHAPGYDNWATTLSNGAGDALNKVAHAFLDPGDVILVEEFTFTPFLRNVNLAGGIPVPVKLDLDTTPGKSNGMDLKYLTDLLDNWDALKPDLKGKKPKALYTIPTGQNPTGLVQSAEFRQRVYELAVKHDFVIIEDDPYGYLTLPPFSSSDISNESLAVEDYLESYLVPSYLNFDTTGRVIRVDTFSKLFAPGMRLGFITGHKEVIDSITQYANVTTSFSSGIAQVLMNNIVEQSFGGVEGWFQWVIKLRTIYIRRRNVLLGALFNSEAFTKGYINMIDPRAGLFTIVVVNFPEGTDVPEKMRLLQFKLRAAGVNAVDGLSMAVDEEFSEARGNFFRLTYAFADSEEELLEGAKRLALSIDEFFTKGLEF